MRLIGFLALSLLSLGAGVLMIESLTGQPVLGDFSLSALLDGVFQFIGSFGSFLGGGGVGN